MDVRKKNKTIITLVRSDFTRDDGVLWSTLSAAGLNQQSIRAVVELGTKLVTGPDQELQVKTEIETGANTAFLNTTVVDLCTKFTEHSGVTHSARGGSYFAVAIYCRTRHAVKEDRVVVGYDPSGAADDHAQCNAH